MNDSSYILNELLQKIRAELGYTQLEFAEELHCTQEYISKLETKNRELTFDIIFILADIAKMDLHFFRYLASKFKNKKDCDNFYLLNTLVDSNDIDNIDKLEAILEQSKSVKELNYGEGLTLVNYCNVLIAYYKYKDYNKAIQLSLDFLGWEEDKFGTYKIITIKSSYFYGIYSLMASSYSKLNKFDIAKKLCEDFFTHTEEVWKHGFSKILANTYLYRRYYIELLAININVAKQTEDFNVVLSLCDNALNVCSELNLLQQVKYILKIKIELLCYENQMDTAKQILVELKTICKYSHQSTYYADFYNYLSNKYTGFSD